MPIVQISRIQHRRGKATDLPQLAAGELGWSIDDQKLYIGNGTVADGAPAVGNTEILTSGSASFSTGVGYTYQGYLGTSTPIVTGSSGDISRTLQQSLDDYVSVKAFGALGDDSTDDSGAVQRAIDELYSDSSDQDDTRARRILFFPAGVYRVDGSITIPPYAHLVGEGPDKSVIRQQGSNEPVLITEDDDGQTGSNIGDNSATIPTQIQIENMTFRNLVAYAGFQIDRTTHVYVNNCKFQGAYATSSNVDNADCTGITVSGINGATTESSNIVFNQCQFTKFARLVELPGDVTHMRFTNCDFSIGYYGAILGSGMDGSTSGFIDGPRDIQFTGCSWSEISRQAIFVVKGPDALGPRQIISHGNFFAKTVSNGHAGYSTVNEFPIITFNTDECSSIADFFERTDLRRDDGSSELNLAPEVQGIGRYTNRIKQVTLSDNTSGATTTSLEYPAGQGVLGKSIVLNYKIERGLTVRAGTFTISVSSNGVQTNDEFTESNGDAGITLSATLGREDSSSISEQSVLVKYTSTNTGYDATMDAEATTIV